mgnify:CR=1 FL=1
MTILDLPAPTIQPPNDEPPVDAPPPAASGEPPGRPRRKRHRRRVIAAVLVALMIPTGLSYGQYMTAPGDAPVDVRSVEWLRDHGFESAVANVEQWWYSRQTPTGTTVAAADVVKIPASSTPAPSAAGAGTAASPPTTVDAIPTVISPAQPAEGVWSSVAGLSTGGVDETFIRPDTAYPSVAVNLVRFDQQRTRLVYAPGTKEPVGGSWKWSSEIPRSERSRTVAAFNAGFKFKDTAGGVYTEGKSAVRPLEDGLASVVIHSDGTANVARWGRDATMSADVVSVRQNLSLIVDGGAPVDGLMTNADGLWGSRKSQLQYTARSGLGVDAQGRLLYAAGRDMSLGQLASALADAGAVRAMQLDIHNQMVSFSYYRPDTGSANGVSATKLISGMKRDATRYLSADQRDFFAVQAR